MILAALLLGCPPPPEPLVDRKAALAALDATPMPDGWAPPATVVLSPQLVSVLVKRGADVAARTKPLPAVTLQPPVGQALSLTPKLQPPDVVFGASAKCPYCLDLGVAWKGSVTLGLGAYSGDVGWRSDVHATVEVDGSPKTDGFEIDLVPIDRDSWTVNLDLDQTPPIYGSLIESVLERRIEVGLRDAGPLSAPFPLATVPPGGDVRLRGLRTRADKGLAIDLAFSTLEAGEVREVPDPADGFAVVLPAKTLLGVAEAALLREGVQNGYQAVPTGLHLDQDRFELSLRVYKQARHEKWREYLIRGALGLDANGAIEFQPDGVAELARESWSTPIDPLIKKAVLNALSKAAAVTVPGRYVHAVGDTALVVDITKIAAKDDELTVWGSVH